MLDCRTGRMCRGYKWQGRKSLCNIVRCDIYGGYTKLQPISSHKHTLTPCRTDEVAVEPRSVWKARPRLSVNPPLRYTRCCVSPAVHLVASLTPLTYHRRSAVLAKEEATIRRVRVAFLPHQPPVPQWPSSGVHNPLPSRLPRCFLPLF